MTVANKGLRGDVRIQNCSATYDAANNGVAMRVRRRSASAAIVVNKIASLLLCLRPTDIIFK